MGASYLFFVKRHKRRNENFSGSQVTIVHLQPPDDQGKTKESSSTRCRPPQKDKKKKRSRQKDDVRAQMIRGEGWDGTMGKSAQEKSTWVSHPSQVTEGGVHLGERAGRGGKTCGVYRIGARGNQKALGGTG